MMLLRSDRRFSYLAGILLAGATLLALASVWNDSLTFDEKAHIPAGYSYLVARDMRINPEHPPLVKDLAALPLLFQDIRPPFDSDSWRGAINGQWEFGNAFFFERGNDVDAILHASRGIMLIIFILSGWLVWRWARQRYGPRTALIVLLLFVLSPTILAHSRYVTTDSAAALGFIAGLYYFLRWHKMPSTSRLIVAGVVFGIAQLLKFSLILLVPLYAILVILFWVTARDRSLREFMRRVAGAFLIGVIGFVLVVLPVYAFHVSGMPSSEQVRQSAAILETGNVGPVEQLVLWSADKTLLRPLSQYLLGLSMVYLRTSGGNTTFFMGETSAEGSPLYFPIVFLLKEPIPLLLLMLCAGVILLGGVRRTLGGSVAWIRAHHDEVSWLLFIVVYWAISVMGNLNIGVRHVLPTLPFVFLLIGYAVSLLRKTSVIQSVSASLLIGAFLLWYAAESLFTFPFYLSYFNEIAGGPEGGHRYVVDSNLDWGQDLKRLSEFVDEHAISSMQLAYFGGDQPSYRLREQYVPFDWSASSHRGWIAVSATLLQGECGKRSPTYRGDPASAAILLLCDKKEEARAGYSIFIYRFDE